MRSRVWTFGRLRQSINPSHPSKKSLNTVRFHLGILEVADVRTARLPVCISCCGRVIQIQFVNTEMVLDVSPLH